MCATFGPSMLFQAPHRNQIVGAEIPDLTGVEPGFMIYDLFSFPLSGEGHCYRFPQLQQALCSRGGDSPQHWH